MIDDSFLKTEFAGKDGFVWWFGRVANASVWKNVNTIMSQEESYGQRVKVRIIGYHPWTNELAEEDLPWATVMMDPITGAGNGGMGDAMCLQGGESCVGFFMDGEEAQQPVILGLINRHNGIKNSISESELKNNKSSGFRNMTGRNEDKLTKRKSKINAADTVKPPNSPKAQKGLLKDVGVAPFQVNDFNSNTIEPITTGVDNETEIPSLTVASGDPGKGKKEGGVIADRGQASDAAKVSERKGTRVHTNPSNCKNDAIGQITQALTDFITLTNSLESSLGKFIDPIANKIYDMDAELRRIVRQVKGLVKSVLNNIRDGIIGKLNFLFSKFLGTLNLVNPLDFLSDEASRLAFQKVVDIIFCIFEKLLEDLVDFLKNMFNALVEDVVSGPICAAEQFVSGIFAKVFEQLENLMEPVLSGLDWLIGGIGTVSSFLGKASNLAQKILNFIGCDGRKCTTPSKWASTLSGSIESSADNWERQVGNIDLLKGVSSDLTRIQGEAAQGIGGFFGSDEFNQSEYNGMRLEEVLKATDKLTGGNSAGALNDTLGSIESAIATSSFFGKNSIFNSCNITVNNPTNQRELMPMPPGFVFDKCITPEIEISGKGSGATATPIVNEFGKIIATEITSRGSGYDSSTTASIIDNTNNGRNAELKVLVDTNGEIGQIVVLNTGFGYCPNLAPIGSNPVGIITGIYIDRPGIGYTTGDTIIIPIGPGTDPDFDDSIINIEIPIPDPITGVILDDPDSPEGPGGDPPPGGGDGPGGPGPGTGGDPPPGTGGGPPPGTGGGGPPGPPPILVDPVPTPGNGGIIDVIIPEGLETEYGFLPRITINSRNGVGANLIPILSYKQLDNKDTTPNRSGLVGITSVIDCI